MTMAPLFLVLAGAAGLGVYNLMHWLRGERRPGLIAAHLLLGIGGAEGLVSILHGSSVGDDDPARATAKTALLLLAAAIGTGFAAPLLRKSGFANLALAAHVCAGAAGFLLTLSLSGRL